MRTRAWRVRRGRGRLREAVEEGLGEALAAAPLLQRVLAAEDAEGGRARERGAELRDVDGGTVVEAGVEPLEHLAKGRGRQRGGVAGRWGRSKCVVRAPARGGVVKAEAPCDGQGPGVYTFRSRALGHGQILWSCGEAVRV